MKFIVGNRTRVSDTMRLYGLSMGDDPVDGLPYLSGNAGGTIISGGGGGGGNPATEGLDYFVTAGAILKTVNDSVEIPIDANYTIVEAEIFGDVSGSAVVDVLRASDGGFPTFTSIAGSNKPTLTSQRRVKDTALGGWTTALVPGDTLQFKLESMTTITAVTVSVKLKATADISFSTNRIMTLVRTFSISGQTIDIPIDTDSTILEAEIQSDINSSAACSVKRATDAGFGTFTRIDNNVNTALSGTRRLTDTVLASWNKNLAAGDTLRLTCEDLSTAVRVTFALKLQVGTVTGSAGYSGNTTVGTLPRVIGVNTLGDSGLSDDGTALAMVLARGWRPRTRTIISGDAALATDHTLVCRGTFTLTLPLVVNHVNGELLVINDGTGTVTVASAGTDLVAVLTGETTTYALTQGQTLTLRGLDRTGADVWRAV